MRYSSLSLSLPSPTPSKIGSKEVRRTALSPVVLISFLLLARVGWALEPEVIVTRPLQPEYQQAQQDFLKLSWATYLRTNRKFPKSGKLYQQVAESYPESAFLQTQIATVSLAIQDIKAAEKAARRAIELGKQDESSENPEPHFLLGQILLKHRSNISQSKTPEWREAIAEFQKVIELDPDHVNAYRYIGEIALLKQEHDLAVQAFKALTRIMPYQTTFYLRLGKSYQETGQNTEAISAFERAVKIDPLLWQAHESLGQLYIDRYDQLEDAVYEAVEPDPEAMSQAQASMQRAIEAYSKVRELKQKQAKPEQLAKYDYGLLTFRSRLGSLYLAADQPEQAIETLLAILDVDSSHSDTNYLLGLAYQQTGKYDQSEHHLRAVVKTTERPAAYNALGYLFAERDKNLDEAVELITFALEKDPDNGAYLDSLGWVYYKQGKTKKAIKQLKKAISLEPDSWEIQDHLGDAYLKDGNIPKAISSWEKAADLAPNNKSIQEKLQRYTKTTD